MGISTFPSRHWVRSKEAKTMGWSRSRRRMWRMGCDNKPPLQRAVTFRELSGSPICSAPANCGGRPTRALLKSHKIRVFFSSPSPGEILSWSRLTREIWGRRLWLKWRQIIIEPQRKVGDIFLRLLLLVPVLQSICIRNTTYFQDSHFSGSF